MEADNDRLNSKLKGATILDFEAAKAQAHRSKTVSFTRSVDPAISRGAGILAIIFVMYLILRAIN